VGGLTSALARRLSDDARSWSVLALFTGIVAAVLDAAFVIAPQDDV